jgi:hypothetical protein
MKTKCILLPLILGIGLILAVIGLLDVPSSAAPLNADEPVEPAAPLTADDALTLELVSQVGGDIRDVAVQGNYIYLGVGPRLLVLDASDPAAPILLGQSAMLGGNVGAIDVAGDYVYLLADGLHVISVTDPTNPTLVGHFESMGGYDVHVAGDYAYLVGFGRLHVLSITDPTTPTEVGQCNGGSMYAVQVAGDYAYVAGTSYLTDTKHLGGLVIISLADPAHPVEVDFRQTAGLPKDLQIVGNHIYIVSTFGYFDFTGYLETFALDTPGAPNAVGQVAIAPFDWGSSYASGLHVAGDYAYVSADYGGMVVISVTDPAHPTELGHRDTPGRSYNVAASGDHAYVADDWGGLRVISVADPNNPVAAGQYVPAAAGRVNSIHVVDDYAYLGGGYGGLWVVSVADPQQPVNSGHVLLSGGFDSVDDVYAVGDYVYAADVLNGLKVFAVADKANPSLLGRADTIHGGQSIHVVGGYAYMATSNEYLPDPDNHPSGLYVFAVSDPAHPTPLGSYLTEGGARAVSVAGDHAYLGIWPPAILQPGRLEAVSVADPTQPTLTGFYTSTLLKPYGLQVTDDNAYLATTWGLWAVSVADPNRPTSLGVEYSDSAKSVHIVGERAYLARDGVSVVSVTDLTQPTELGAYPLGDAEDVYAAGDYIYVANGNGGLVILRVTEPAAISGQMLDGRGDPVADIRISAGGPYSATTDANGVYTITGLLPGAYTLTPMTPGYFWSPANRTVTVPPSAGDQDFVGRQVQKVATPTTYQGTLGLGDRLTYTLRLVYHEDGDLLLYDPLPAYTGYVSGSLKVPGLTYHSSNHTISGTLGMTAGEQTTITFAVQVKIMGTAGFAPTIVNQACLRRPGQGLADCEWSNQVSHYTYLWPLYLPLVIR